MRLVRPVRCCFTNMVQDPLQYLPVDKWNELQFAFKSDWPRGISGYNVLKTQRRLLKQGFDYGFKVYVPYGDVWNGMVAINEKSAFYEVIIQCPRDDTEKLEEALRKTEIINWRSSIIIPFTPYHVIECVKRAIEDVNVEIERLLPSESFILDKHKSLFKNIRLPPGVTFGHLSIEHLDLVNSTWPHRYPTSSWYFELLIKTKSGYGLFKNNSLISWVFINESGTLSHMYTLEEYRKKGHAEILLKLLCNIALAEKNDVFAFCVKGNVNACKLYKKVGFENFNETAWCYLKFKSK